MVREEQELLDKVMLGEHIREPPQGAVVAAPAELVKMGNQIVVEMVE
jgi:hypothetical protein